jgi:4-hydroxymandelate oxidase
VGLRLDREDEARALLEAGTYAFFATGAGVEETLRANVEGWREWWLRPHGLRDVSEVDLRTTVLGIEVSSPVMVAPTAFHRLAHPDGEMATARATGEVGGLFVLSTRATVTLQDVSAVAGPWWLQVYVLRDRGMTAEVVRRAADAGARALVLTVDTPVVGSKRRETHFELAGMDTLVPGLSMERDDDGLYQAPDVAYDAIGWLRELSGGLPVVVKGVVRGDDARAAVDAGASAVWVSNHGGRQLDGCVPTAVALPEVVEAVGNEAEVYVDGGIRHGRDVLRALALGARAVAVGRPVLWALTADGGPGVRDLLTDLAADLAEALQLAGVRSPAEVSRDLVVRRLA